MLDPRAEAPALRRAAILLQRACEGGADEDFAALLSGVAAMQRAAAAGLLVDHDGVDRMRATLSGMAPLSCGRGSSMEHIVRCNAMTEMRDLLIRLAACEVVAEEGRSPGR